MSLNDKNNLGKEEKRYYEKVLLYENKTEEDLYVYPELCRKLDEVCHYLDEYMNDQGDSGIWSHTIYHLDDSTVIFSDGPSGEGNYPKSEYPRDRTFKQLLLVSDKEITDTVNKICSHISFFKKFEEAEKRMM